MAYQYEKVNHELLVPQIEDQLMMYMKQENIAIGEKLPSEYKLAELFGVGRSTIREPGGEERLRHLCQKRRDGGRGSPGACAVRG